MWFAKRWRNLIIIPSFQYSEHTLESYCHCESFSVYVIHLKRKQQSFLHWNMSNFVPEKVFLRGVLLHYFNMKKTAAESHRILVEVYGEHALAERTCQKLTRLIKGGTWFRTPKIAWYSAQFFRLPNLWNVSSTVEVGHRYTNLAEKIYFHFIR